MARGVNKVILVGNLGDDPESKATPSGTSLCNFRLATTENFTDRDGNPQERTEWHRIVVWGKLAENCIRYLHKGRLVYVEGSLRTRSWEQDGNKRYMTEINAREVHFLGNKGDGATSDSQGSGSANSEFGGPPPMGDDIPF